MATLRDVARAVRTRVERTIVAELTISMVEDAKASPTVSAVTPANRVNARYFSTTTNRRSRRNLSRIKLSGNPR